MAIGARTKPQVLVIGAVTNVRVFRRKIDQELLGHNIEVDTDGAPVGVTYWASDAQPPAPGEYVAIYVGVDESREAQLVYIRNLNPGDLDLIGSNAFGKAKV